MQDINRNYCIYDHRLKSKLKSMTLSGYKKSEVIKALNLGIINSKINDALRWGIELHISGYTENIFSELLNIYVNNINILNPYFFFYFINKRKYYNKLISNVPKNIIIFTRNNQEIRNLIMELISILVYSKKNNMFQSKSLPKIPKYAYEYVFIKQKVISKNTNEILKYLNGSDLNEIKISLNEIINILNSKSKTFSKITFWYLWIKKYVKEYKKVNIDREISKRHEINDIDEKYKNDWTWSLWNIFCDYSKSLNKKYNIYVNKLYSEFKLDYKGYEKKDKNSIILYVIYILTNKINFDINIRQNISGIIHSNCIINIIYKSIEKQLLRGYNPGQIEHRLILYNKTLHSENKKLDKKKDKIIKELSEKKVLKKNMKKINAYNNIKNVNILRSNNLDNYYKKKNNNNIKKYFKPCEKKTIKLDKNKNKTSYKNFIINRT